jgi:hypothetical protein
MNGRKRSGKEMRPKLLNFEQLVQENKRALLSDEKRINQIELRLEKKQTDLVSYKRRNLKLS